MTKKNRTDRRNRTRRLATIAAAATEQTTGQTAVELDAMKCSACGNEVEADDNFCIHCGANLKAVEVKDEKATKKGPGMIRTFLAAVWGFCLARFRKHIAEFGGGFDLVMSKVGPFIRSLNSKPGKIIWSIATITMGVLACVYWSPVFLGAYVIMTSIYQFAEPLTLTVAVVGSAGTMVAVRVYWIYRGGRRLVNRLLALVPNFRTRTENKAETSESMQSVKQGG